MKRKGTHLNNLRTSVFCKKNHFFINFAIFTIAGSYPTDLVVFANFSYIPAPAHIPNIKAPPPAHIP